MDRVTFDFPDKETARVFRIMAEFVVSFEQLSHIGPAVTIFGSARTKPSNIYYKKAVKLSRLLAQKNLAVITGGGPGIMEAANKGAALAKGVSVGLNIQLPSEQSCNEFINHPINFHYFFCRKVCFVKYASAFVLFPGGFRTLDECFELLTLIQTERISKFPVIFFGKKYWSGLHAWIKTTLKGGKYISPDDLLLYHITDSPEEAFEIVYTFQRQNEGSAIGPNI